MQPRHFLHLTDISSQELTQIINRGIELKTALKNNSTESTDGLMHNKAAVLIFEKNSSRTRISFEIGVHQFGGKCVTLSQQSSHLGNGESLEDTAKTISTMAHLVIMRTGAHDRIERLSKNASIPVINGLSDFNHPCQLLADLQTYTEFRGSIANKKVAWIGDGNNVCHSWMNAAMMLDFHLAISTPKHCRPNNEMIEKTSKWISLPSTKELAAESADLIVTDTWHSMGFEKDFQKKRQYFKPYQITSDTMKLAKHDCLFMHCLPAYRNEEISADMIDSPWSVVWHEAENRLHAQKALIEFLLQKK